MDEKEPGFCFKATGIGSVPFVDTGDTCVRILERLPHMPYWPQLVKRSHLEDMTIQYSEGLPLLRVSEERRTLILSTEEVESALVSFYDRFMSDRVDTFAIGEEYASGLYALITAIRKNPDAYGPYVKGQTVGPVTFAAGIYHADGKSLLFHPDLLEAMVKGIAIKALWQVRELEKTGKFPVLFLDEPSLSGFGSAFSPIERHEVIALLREVIQYVRDRSAARIGIHCCGNTDWSMIIESGPDIVNFDAYSYMKYFLLYPEDISRFLNAGGTIAWGIVPTADFTGQETVDGLFERLDQGLNTIQGWGLPSEILTRQSILTPACGMGSMERPASEKVLDLLASLSERCMQSCG